MATYNKPTLRVMIYTKMDGAAIAEGIMAQAALDAYKAKKTVKGLDGDQHEVLIPYHAITQFQYGYITEEAEKADAYCGGGTEPVGEVWDIIPSWNDCSHTGGQYKYPAVHNRTEAFDCEALVYHGADYRVFINGTELRDCQGSSGHYEWSNGGILPEVIADYDRYCTISVNVPCDWDESTDTIISVAHK